MATTSSSSSFTYEWTYDVFISFRGVDTRRGFTGNLFKALRETKEVKAFMDDQDLEPGAKITPALIKAIQESRIALVIFSKNYAASTYCLEELANIMECSEEKGMLVWPVFYQVNPAEVRHHQKGSYAEALAKHETRSYGKRKLERWRLVLQNAANLSGWHIKPDTDKYEYEFIENIIQSISKKINSLQDCDMNQLQPKPPSSRFKHLQVQDANQPKGVKSFKGKEEAQLEITQPKPRSSSSTYEIEHFSDKQVHNNKQPKPWSSSFTYEIEHFPDKQVHNNKQPKPQSSSFTYEIEHFPDKQVHNNKQPKPWYSSFTYEIEHLPDKGVHKNKQPKPQSSSFSYHIEHLPDKGVHKNKSSTSFSYEVSVDGGGGGHFPGADPNLMPRIPYHPQQHMDATRNMMPPMMYAGLPPFPPYSFSSDEEQSDEGEIDMSTWFAD